MVKYIYTEVSKCQFGAEKIMSDQLICPPTISKYIDTKIGASLRVAQIFIILNNIHTITILRK